MTMTAPPREQCPKVAIGELCSCYSYGKGADYCPFAAPAPSADQDHNGGQGHAASVHCSLGALPLESGNAREATCLNTEPSARTGTDTQQGQLGANAGSIPAPPTSTPAAQPAELVLPCAIDGCKQPSLMPASEYCSLHSAIGTSPTGGEFAPAPSAEPPAQAATDDLVQRCRAQAETRGGYCGCPREDYPEWQAADLIEQQDSEIESLRAECGLRQIQGYNEGKEAASARLYEAEAEQLTRDMRQRAERAEAERDALRECLKAIIGAYDSYRRRGVAPAPVEYADIVRSIDAARAKVQP